MGDHRDVFGKNLTRSAFVRGAAGAALALGAAPLSSALATVPNPKAPPLHLRPVHKSPLMIQLPMIGLGTRSMSKTEAKAVAGQAAVIDALFNGGGTVIDTASNYTGGDSEQVIGDALEKTGLRGQAFIATKISEQGKEAGLKAIENSFARLKTQLIDLMFVHNMVDIPTQLPALQDLKMRQRVRYVGISETSDTQDELIKHLDGLDFVEFAYAADFRQAEKNLLPACLDKGVSTLIALPLGRGRTLNKVKGQQVPEWAKKELAVETWAQLLLKFVISHPAVTVAIPSTLDPKHMVENLAAGRGPIPDAKQRERIAAIWA